MSQAFLKTMDENPKTMSLQEFVTLGKDSQCQIQVQGEQVAERHARIEKKDQSYLIRDLRTPQGTYVNDARVIETYLMNREQLRGLLLVMDIRRSWTEDEELLKEFSERRGFPLAVVLTKADKMSRSQMLQAVAKVKKASGLSAVFGVSALKKEGQDAVEDYIYENWIKE